jgi:ferredoxin
MEPRLCDKCKICVKTCPAKALSKDESVEFILQGKSYSYAKLDEERCGVGFQCGSEETNPFLYDGSENAEISRWMINNIYNDDDKSYFRRQIHSRWVGFDVMYNKHAPSQAGVYNFRHPGCMCGTTCQRECMIHLEKQNKLENKFHTEFRIRKPWKLDAEKILAQQEQERDKIAEIRNAGTKLTNYDGRKA